MATIGQAASKVEAWAAGFNRFIVSLIQSNAKIVEECVREQIESGQDGNGNSLSPTYLNDPYFDKYGNKAAAMAQAYRNWKMSITPPQSGTLLGLPPRDPDVPNLRINGYYQDGIKANSKSDGVSIKGTVSFSGEIDGKYGADLLKMGQTAREYFNNQIVKPALKDFLK